MAEELCRNRQLVTKAGQDAFGERAGHSRQCNDNTREEGKRGREREGERQLGPQRALRDYIAALVNLTQSLPQSYLSVDALEEHDRHVVASIRVLRIVGHPVQHPRPGGRRAGYRTPSSLHA